MKLGIIGGMGRTATDRYRDILDHLQIKATFSEVDTEAVVGAILSKRYDLLSGLIDPAAKRLREEGCTHAALACVSCQKDGNEAITKHGMVPLGIGFALNTHWVKLTVIAYSTIVDNLIAATPQFNLVKPPDGMQQRIDDFIMGPGGVGLNAQSTHPYRSELWQYLLHTPAIVGCTDLELPAGAPSVSIDIANEHCLTIASFVRDATEQN